MKFRGIPASCIIVSVLMLSGCFAPYTAPSQSPSLTPSSATMPTALPSTSPSITPFSNLSMDHITAALNAEGPDSKNDAYTLIAKVLGSSALETPDQFDGKKHIFMDTDPIVGPYFYFVLHYPADLDKTNTKNTDRQRNEIKVYDGSNNNLKGYKDKTFTYRWKFKPDSEMKVSDRFFHLFQIKSTGSGQAPLLTLTPRNNNKMELIHTDSKGKGSVLATADWSKIKGSWIQASVTATFSHKGALSVTLKTLDGTTLMSYSSTNIDIWMNDNEFIRPKWGIYRGLTNGLNDAKVSFANFEIINHSQ
jgi:hypothetical protein